jgi:hypothetical protein
MSKNLTLIQASIRACALLSNAIDDLAEDMEECCSDGLPDTREALREAYDSICRALSQELKVDAHQMIQQMIGAELTAARAILTAQTGIRFPEAGA